MGSRKELSRRGPGVIGDGLLGLGTEVVMVGLDERLISSERWRIPEVVGVVTRGLLYLCRNGAHDPLA